MIENMLYQAAQSLPTPKTIFCEIEIKAEIIKRQQSYHIRRYRMVAAMLVCAFLLMGSAAVAATTEVNYSAWAMRSNAFRDAEIIGEKMGIVLPESLDDSPFYNVTTMYVAPEGTTYLDALINPAYPWYAADYGVQDVVREYSSDGSDGGSSTSSVVYDEYSLAFGSTENELYKYVFSLDESGTLILEDSLSGSYRTEEYKGTRMLIVTEAQYDRDNGNDVFAYHHRIIWVDEENHAVFSLHKSFYADENAADQLPEEMIAFVKEIIDMN